MNQTEIDLMMYRITRELASLEKLALKERVAAINAIRKEVAKYSPFNKEPVDCVQWVKSEAVVANDYNPNSVAPPEMELLAHSISEDGYTQPIVAWKETEADAICTVIDGFHRHRVGKENAAVQARVLGYLPLVVINQDRSGRNDRIASTIRHNRARGKHRVESMSDIVIELKKRNWSDVKISKELGMDADEVLRLCQISGLAEVFSDGDFSKSWDVGIFNGSDEELLTDAEIAAEEESK